MGEELRRLSADLRSSAKGARPEARKVVKRGAQNVKNVWKANARESAGDHGRLYPRSINYDDPEVIDGWITSEIGPDKNKPQGALGNLIEFGSVNNPPNNDGGRAMDVEEPGFLKAMDDVGRDVL